MSTRADRFRTRLTANANDFDGIVADMLGELDAAERREQYLAQMLVQVRKDQQQDMEAFLKDRRALRAENVALREALCQSIHDEEETHA